MQCAGGPNGDACIMRCRNSAIAGPFGSCVAVTNANSANSTASTTTAAAETTSSAAAANDDKVQRTAARTAHAKKRYVISRIAGKRAGHWIDA